MVTKLEKALNDFEKSERIAIPYVYLPYSGKSYNPRVGLLYVPEHQRIFKGHTATTSPKALFISKRTDIDELTYDNKIDFNDDYSISKIYNMNDGVEIMDPERIKENTSAYQSLLEDGLGLDPRYIISNYKEQLKKIDKGVYRTQLMRTSGGGLFCEICLSNSMMYEDEIRIYESKIETIRLYSTMGKRFENFGKYKDDFYMEAMPLIPSSRLLNNIQKTWEQQIKD
jgi:hypothetical protein